MAEMMNEHNFDFAFNSINEKVNMRELVLEKAGYSCFFCWMCEHWNFDQDKCQKDFMSFDVIMKNPEKYTIKQVEEAQLYKGHIFENICTKFAWCRECIEEPVFDFQVNQ